MKKKERRAIVTGAPIVCDRLTIISLAALVSSTNTRARVLVCVCCVPGIGRAALSSVVGIHYNNLCILVAAMVECGAVSACARNRQLFVTSKGMDELEALVSDLLGNVERLRLKVSLQRFGRPDLLSFGMDEK